MAGVNFISGLSSGLDWATMIDQLMKVEGRAVDVLERRQSQYQDKLTAWQSFNTKLLILKDKARALSDIKAFKVYTSSITSSSETGPGELLRVTTGADAEPGTHKIVIAQRATNLSIQSRSFSSSSAALGLSGDFIISGKVIKVDATDSLISIKDKVNASNTGSSPSGVAASIISISATDHRLVLTSAESGEEGFTPLEADANGILQALGLKNGIKSIKNATSNGAESDRFSSSTMAVGSLLDLTSPPSSTTITIGNKSNININLGTMSLTDIKNAIQAAAPTGVTVAVKSETVDDETVYYLDISGTVNFGDSNNVLEALGILKGGRGAVAEVHRGSVANTSVGAPVTASAKWKDIDNTSINVNETISITGTDHNGNAISATHTIANLNNTVQDLLDAIKAAFSNTVTASITADGKVQVTDNTAGDSQLSLTLVANNELGGGLNFGSISASTEGYSMELQAGQDARLTVNGVTVTRSDNQIDDLIPGVALDLLKADALTTLTLTVERDVEAIKLSVQGFLDEYNTIIDFINEQNTYDEEKDSGGVLMGDGTLSSLQFSLQRMVFSKILGLPSGMDSLFLIGIKSDKEGTLSLDGDKFASAIGEDFNGVTRVFVADGDTTDSDVEYISHTRETKAGTYEVTITTAATQGTVTGTTNLSGGIGGAETFTVTDAFTGRQAIVTLNSGDSIDTIVSALNQEFAQRYAQTLTGSVANTTNGSTPITADTTWASIYNANVSNGDTIKIQGTTRSGVTVYNYYTVEDAATDKVSGLLSAIEGLFDNTVTAYINSNGKLVVSEDSVGDSQLTLSVIANNEGGGSLDFGSMDATVTGRNAIEITASNSGGYLKLTHNNYGSANGFTVSQSTNYTGIANGSYTGVDVAGTINGESAAGKGQLLRGDSGQSNIEGLTIKVTLTPSELAAQGSSQGSISLTMGVAEQVDRMLDFITDKYSDGYVANRLEFIQDTIDDIQGQIDHMNSRLEAKRERLIAQFVAMETTLSQMRTMSDWLSQQITFLLGSWGY